MEDTTSILVVWKIIEEKILNLTWMLEINTQNIGKDFEIVRPTKDDKWC